MIRINLLKPEAKEVPTEEFKREKKPPPTNLVYLVFIVLAAFLFFNQRNAIRVEQNRLEAAQEEKNKLKDVLVKLEKVEAQKKLFEKKINLIKQLKPRQGVAVRIMDELSKHIPYWVWLTEATYSKQIVHIKGNAISNNLIADYIYNLEVSPYFRNINLISSTQRTMRGNQFLEFALNARYIVQQPTKPPSTEGTKEVAK